MKIYESTCQRTRGESYEDCFTSYLGLDKAAAIEAAEADWSHLTECEKKCNIVDVTEWEAPEDLDVTDLKNAFYDWLASSLNEQSNHLIWSTREGFENE